MTNLPFAIRILHWSTPQGRELIDTLVFRRDFGAKKQIHKAISVVTLRCVLCDSCRSSPTVHSAQVAFSFFFFSFYLSFIVGCKMHFWYRRRCFLVQLLLLLFLTAWTIITCQLRPETEFECATTAFAEVFLLIYCTFTFWLLTQGGKKPTTLSQDSGVKFNEFLPSSHWLMAAVLMCGYQNHWTSANS